MRRRDWLDLAIVLGVWLAAIAFIQPRGNFPLNDDWDFALDTWNFARTGHFVFTHFTAVSLRAQVLWGALWTRAFGQSFEVLRLSTLTMAALTIVLIHRILAQAGLTRTPRIIATLAFAFHPIFLWSSCTYMTEVPYICTSALAMYCFLRGFDDERFGWIVAGCAAAIASWFIRQTGVLNLVVPLAIALWRRRRADAGAIGITMAGFASLLMFKREWLSGSPQEFAVHYRMWQESSFRVPQQIEVAYHWGVFNAQNGALFFLPLVLPLVLLLRSRRQIAILVSLTLLIFFRVQALISTGRPMPYFVTPFCCDIFAGNILVDFGLGPQSMAGAFPFTLPQFARLALSYASVLLAGLLVTACIRPLRTTAEQLSLGTAVVGTAALLGSGLYVDRYALDSAWSLGIFLALVIPWTSPRARTLTVCALIVVGVFSVFSVDEYFAWNRARWHALADLRTHGVPIHEIDGGSEVFDFYELSRGDQRMRRIFQFGVPPRRFTISFQPMKNHRVIGIYPFSGWLGLHRGAIYVCEDRL